jgi:hypothetical protein
MLSDRTRRGSIKRLQLRQFREPKLASATPPRLGSREPGHHRSSSTDQRAPPSRSDGGRVHLRHVGVGEHTRSSVGGDIRPILGHPSAHIRACRAGRRVHIIFLQATARLMVSSSELLRSREFIEMRSSVIVATEALISLTGPGSWWARALKRHRGPNRTRGPCRRRPAAGRRAAPVRPHDLHHRRAERDDYRARAPARWEHLGRRETRQAPRAGCAVTNGSLS